MPVLPSVPNSPAVLNDVMQLPPSVPQLPADVIKRFSSLSDWQEEMAAWYKAIVISLQDQVSDTSDNVTQQNSDTNQNALNVRGLTSAVIMISAIAGKASGITVSDIAPGAPAVGDVWVNTTDPANVITYQWDGSNWVVLTQPIAFAAVAQEQAARITADGFLSGKYTLTVVAGNVVTGMNITSSTGGGTNISQVIFEADKFLIYSGTTGEVMFVTDAINHTVALAGVLIVNSTDNKVYIGAGNYGNADTAWYVDSTGIMSLKDKFTWDGTTLTISGYIAASFVAVDSLFYNVADNTKTMQANTWQHMFSDNGGGGWNGMNVVPTEVWLISFYGWTNASGSADTSNRFGKSTVEFTCIENGGATPVGGVGSYTDIAIIYRVNGGATQQVTAFDARALSGNGTLNISGGVQVSGLAGGDLIEFGVRLKGGLALDMVNVVDLTVSCINI